METSIFFNTCVPVISGGAGEAVLEVSLLFRSHSDGDRQSLRDFQPEETDGVPLTSGRQPEQAALCSVAVLYEKGKAMK